MKQKRFVLLYDLLFTVHRTSPPPPSAASLSPVVPKSPPKSLYGTPRTRPDIKRRVKCRKRLEFGQLKQKKTEAKKKAQEEKQSCSYHEIDLSTYKSSALLCVDRSIMWLEQTDSSITELMDVAE